MTAEEQPEKSQGMVTTFYSFKGGVGRSMTLANVASLLSKWGKRVLITDWDLEAPGIEKFFTKWLRDTPGFKQGIVDLITDWSLENQADWRSCVVKVRPPGGQEIHIITAGKEDGKYVTRLRAIDWQQLFETRKLGNYLEQLRREWKSEYDFVFIDSRTGVTDIGGICTIHLPDVLVAMFVANDQSLSGVKKVLESAGRGHSKMPVDRTKLIVVPVPSRDESTSEYALAEEWRNKFASELKSFFADWVPRDEKYVTVLNYLKIPYFPYWSFGERIPVLEQSDPDNPKTLAYAYQPLAKLLLGGLDWDEVREGSLATEQALKQIAEAERLKTEAARISEESKRRSEESRAREMEAEAQDRKDRIDRFESRVEEQIYHWETVSRSAYSVRLFVFLATALGAIGFMGLTLFRNVYQSSYSVTVFALWISCGAVVLAGAFLIYFGNLGAKPAKARLITRQLSGLRSLFRSRAEPYAEADQEGAFRRYVHDVESILSDGERDYLESRRSKNDPYRTSIIQLAPPEETIKTVTRSAEPGFNSPRSSDSSKETFSFSTLAVAPNNTVYDVFLSYRHADFTDQWVAEFLPLFSFWLSEFLGREALIFNQMYSNASGPYPDAHNFALTASRSFVAICTPSYFNSSVARYEWESFGQRAPGAMLPILFDAGTQLPESEVQTWDFSRFAFVGDGFRQAELYIDFQRSVQELAKKASMLITEAAQFGQTEN